MAKYKKKRIRELQHDRFRDTTMKVLERLGDRLEGKGHAILYSVGGIILIAIIAGFWVMWSNKKKDEARQALGRGITIATAPVATVSTDSSSPSFATTMERAQSAIQEFEKVAAKYGDPYRTEAQYFIATNLLDVDREKGIAQLAELSNSKVTAVGTLSKFALAQAKEADQNYVEAAQLYDELAKLNDVVVTPETAKLRLALVHAKWGKTNEAADLLYSIVDASRKARGSSDGLPKPASGAAREAAGELQKLDPDRYAQLPPEPPGAGMVF